MSEALVANPLSYTTDTSVTTGNKASQDWQAPNGGLVNTCDAADKCTMTLTFSRAGTTAQATEDFQFAIATVGTGPVEALGTFRRFTTDTQVLSPTRIIGAPITASVYSLPLWEAVKPLQE